jgi:hypothetical protein
MNNDMPFINIESLQVSEDDMKIVNLIHVNGRLKSSKPKMSKKHSDEMLVGMAAYVWRMVVFSLSMKREHQCMPVTADFDIPIRNYTERRELTKKLDVLADAVINTVPPTQWYGVHRWARALGKI